MLYIEGNKAFVIDPLPDDSAVYAYGTSHAIVEGRYQAEALAVNHARVEGRDLETGGAIVADVLNWTQIDNVRDRMQQVEDRNIDTATGAELRGEAYLRQVTVRAASGTVAVPVNCGQQLLDVIELSDARTGLEEARRRVLGLTLVYNPRRGEYRQQLRLGGV